MDTNRRGFLKGLSGLVATPLLLSALPIGPAAAQTSTEPLIWTPEGTEAQRINAIPFDPRTNRRMLHRMSVPTPQSRYVKVSVHDEQDRLIMTYGVVHHGGLCWTSMPSEGIDAKDCMLVDLTLTTQSRD